MSRLRTLIGVALIVVGAIAWSWVALQLWIAFIRWAAG